MPKTASPSHVFTITILRFVGILLCVAISAAACTPNVTPTPVRPTTAPTTAPTPVPIDLNQLYANTWALVSYGDPGNPTVVKPGTMVTLNVSQGQISGSGGCNAYNATVQAGTDGSVTVGPVATTRMACPEVMDQESSYLAALQNARSFSLTSSGQLEVKYGPEGAANQVLVYTIGQVPLTGTHWSLVTYGDPSSPQKPPAGMVITAIFADDGVLSGFSGCNQYAGSYKVQNGSLVIGPLATTQKMCPTDTMKVEQAYLAALGTAGQFSIAGQALTVAYNGGEATFSSASLPLEATTWTLAQLYDQSIPAETGITAIFIPAEAPNTGVISGFGGCNTYNAGYTLDGNKITVSPVATTMMACPSGMETEQAFLAGLQAATSYQVLVDKLVLTNPTGNLVFTANRTPLAGALWSLVSLGDVNNPQKPVQGSQFVAQFSNNPNYPTGVLTGSTGCNEYSAAFTASVPDININQPGGTQNKSCVPGLTDQETLYYLALHDAKTYQVSGNTLTLPYDGGKQALVFAGTQLAEAKRPPLSSLNGTTWYLWYINTGPIVPGTKVYAQIVINPDGTSGTMTGSAGCNNYSATFGNNLGVKASLTAGQTCSQPAGVMDQEKTYIQMLTRTFGYWQTGDQLILNTGQGVLTYRNALPPSASDQTHLLVGKTWYLVAYQSTYSSAGTQEPYTVFNSNGTLAGYTGCNSFQGNFSTNIQQITVTNLSSTKTACPSSALNAQEQAMLAILGTAKGYQVVDTVMQIFSDQGALNYSLTPLHRAEEIVPPTAVITGATSGTTSAPMNFNGSSSHGQAPIVAWNWELGNGDKSTGPFISYVYKQPGTYTVKLTVTDQRGYQGSTTMVVTITAPAQPTPTPTPTPTFTPTAPPTAVPTLTPTPTLPPTAVPTQPPAPTATVAATQPPEQPTAAPTYRDTGTSYGYSGTSHSHTGASNTYTVTAYVNPGSDGTSCGGPADCDPPTGRDHRPWNSICWRSGDFRCLWIETREQPNCRLQLEFWKWERGRPLP